MGFMTNIERCSMDRIKKVTSWQGNDILQLCGSENWFDTADYVDTYELTKYIDKNPPSTDHIYNVAEFIASHTSDENLDMVFVMNMIYAYCITVDYDILPDDSYLFARK